MTPLPSPEPGEALPIYSLVYTSLATESFTREQLGELLEKSRIHNESVAITGMLVHLSGAFMQFLEGPKEAVRQLFYEKIAKDERHFEVEVATEGPVPERRFARWTMAFENLEGRHDPRPKGFSDFVMVGFTDELRSKHDELTVAILNKFRENFGTPVVSVNGAAAMP